jgi:hypothetical protein
MKQFLIILAFCLIGLLVGCSKKADPKEDNTPTVDFVSGNYACRDSTYNKIWTGDTANLFRYEIIDSTYTIEVDYIDTLNAIIGFTSKTFILSNNYFSGNTYVSHSGFTRDTLSLADHHLFYLHESNPGGSTYYTRITGSKIN